MHHRKPKNFQDREVDEKSEQQLTKNCLEKMFKRWPTCEKKIYYISFNTNRTSRVVGKLVEKINK